MHSLRVIVAVIFCSAAHAQTGVGVGSAGGGGVQGVWFNAHVEPPSSGPRAQVFSAGSQLTPRRVPRRIEVGRGTCSASSLPEPQTSGGKEQA
jgi:hypothetical protein